MHSDDNDALNTLMPCLKMMHDNTIETTWYLLIVTVETACELYALYKDKKKTIIDTKAIQWLSHWILRETMIYSI